MSNVHTEPEQFQTSPRNNTPPGLAALASTLQEAAQALLAFQSANPSYAAENLSGVKKTEPVEKPEAPEQPGAATAFLTHEPEVPGSTPARTALSSPEGAVAPPSPERNGETRSYYFPPAVVRQEKDLLLRYHTSDFQGLLEEVHTLLVGLVKIMQSVHKDVRVKGYVISSLGAQIEHASALLLRMRNIYGKVIPVRK